MLVQLPAPNNSWVSAADVILVTTSWHGTQSCKSYWLRIWVACHTTGPGFMPNRIDIEMSNAEESIARRDEFARQVNLALKGESCQQ